MDKVLPEYSIYDDIGALICLGICIVIGIFFVIYTLKTESIRDEYFESLNEHDKAVISSYFKKRYRFSKKKTK